MKGLVVAGIGTEVGKTVISAVLCEALEADYWKPIASGTDDGPPDGEIVAGLIQRGSERVHPTRYLFRKSLSPHIAAAMEGVEIQISDLQLPETSAPLVVELAGGVFVPINDSATNLDLLQAFGLPVVVVSKHYLGSINHTLLTLEVLRSRGCQVLGVIFNGEELPDTERIIVQLGRVKVLGRVPSLKSLSSSQIIGNAGKAFSATKADLEALFEFL